MPTRKAKAVWNGTIKEGDGNLTTESGAVDAKYSFGSRFEEGAGTNPDELIGAAHAGCFSMALSMMLTEAGYSPETIETDASVTIEVNGDDIAITTVELDCTASVPDIDADEFEGLAQQAKEGCPVSKALAGVDISLEATLRG